MYIKAGRIFRGDAAGQQHILAQASLSNDKGHWLTSPDTAPATARTKRSIKRTTAETQVGWCELVDLPDLGLSAVRAKMDSGAATSSIHATRIMPFENDGAAWVQFSFRASKHDPAIILRAPVVDRRNVRSSNGKEQLRYVIAAKMEMGALQWEGQLTLANRGSMAFPILLGRRALRRGFLVNSGKRWMLGKPPVSEQ